MSAAKSSGEIMPQDDANNSMKNPGVMASKRAVTKHTKTGEYSVSNGLSISRLGSRTSCNARRQKTESSLDSTQALEILKAVTSYKSERCLVLMGKDGFCTHKNVAKTR